MTERGKTLSGLAGVVLIAVALMMNAPPPEPKDEFLIGPWGELEIKYVAPPLIVDKDTVLGVWYSQPRLILIDRSLRPTMRRGVRAHELCHAALSDDYVVLPDSTEEAVCNAMEKWEIARR
jgi:hypothetical protein